MRYEYYVCTDQSPWLDDFLKRSKIKHKVSVIGDSTLVSFYFYSSSPDADIWLEELKQKNIYATKNLSFTQTDLNRAKILELRPYKYFFDITNEKDSFQYTCLCPTVMGGMAYVHETQVGTIAVRKEPPLNTKTAFFCFSTGGSEIFVDKRIHDLAKEHGLVDVQFRDVLVKGKVSENIFQMDTENVIDLSKIELGYGEEKWTCPACGKVHYKVYSCLYQIHLRFDQIKPGSDLYAVEGIKGSGTFVPKYLISQRFYQLLRKNKLTGNLAFEPVEEAR